MGAVKLQTTRLRKVYPGTVALDDVSMAFEAGRVSALLGKNGAGKSTLVKILSGAVQPTAGQVLVDGRQVRFRSPQEAFRRGPTKEKGLRGHGHRLAGRLRPGGCRSAGSQG